MTEVVSQELGRFWLHFRIQLGDIWFYWLVGIVLGSSISVFGKDKIHRLFFGLQSSRAGIPALIPASLIGLASPLCMYGTIPVAASFAQKGIREDWLAAFMMSSILLNPQLLIYTAALGPAAVLIRVGSCFLCGLAAGLCVRHLYRGRAFFNFNGFSAAVNKDSDHRIAIRLLKNIARNMRATGLYFLAGVMLAALFQTYVPAERFAAYFGGQNGTGVLMAATIGVPIYVCGGGTIPLLHNWLQNGMGLGPAAAFMITGPATKITNLGAVKIVLGARRFAAYLIFSMIFALASGMAVNFLVIADQ